MILGKGSRNKVKKRWVKVGDILKVGDGSVSEWKNPVGT